MPTIAPVLPIVFDDIFGVAGHTTIIGNAKQNLKNLLLTNPSERIDVEYGVGLKTYLFENITSITLETIKSKIVSQASKYLPSINISNIEVNPSTLSENGITIIITFSVSGSDATSLALSV